jgi:3-oxoacyl-[acyl-carrier-protein] synthase-1
MRLPEALAAWDCRATRLAWLGLQADGFIDTVAAARTRHGAHRVGLVLGSSASTIGVSEQAYRALADDGGFPSAVRSETLNQLHAVTAFVQQALALQGPAATVSTACSSSAKAFAQAERWLRLRRLGR